MTVRRYDVDRAALVRRLIDEARAGKEPEGLNDTLSPILNSLHDAALALCKTTNGQFNSDETRNEWFQDAFEYLCGKVLKDIVGRTPEVRVTVQPLG